MSVISVHSIKPLKTKNKAKVLLYPVLPDIRQKISWLEGSQNLPTCSNESSIKMKMNMEHYCNDTDTRNQSTQKKNLSQCHLVQHETHELIWDRTRSSVVTGRRWKTIINLQYTLLSSHLIESTVCFHQNQSANALTSPAVLSERKCGSVDQRTETGPSDKSMSLGVRWLAV